MRRDDASKGCLAAGKGEKSAGDTWLLTNGAPSAIVRPALHAGDEMAEKSPRSVAAVGTALHSTVTAAGAALNTGAVVSWTVIIWVLLLWLPQRSVAVQVRVSV